jgi:hypothetical protein
VSLVRALVSADFLWNEHWYVHLSFCLLSKNRLWKNDSRYLRSIDICKEPFGFYFTFGSGFFLYLIYTLQSQYLVRYPVTLSHGTALGLILLAGAGYALYYIASKQKTMVRDTRGNCTIWGAKASVIEVQFVTSDGVTQTSFLACSGMPWISLQIQIVNFELRILTQSRIMGHCASSKLRRRSVHDLCNGRRVWV